MSAILVNVYSCTSFELKGERYSKYMLNIHGVYWTSTLTGVEWLPLLIKAEILNDI